MSLSKDDFEARASHLFERSIVIDSLVPHPWIDFLITENMRNFIETSLDAGKTGWEIWPELADVLAREMSSSDNIRKLYVESWHESGITAVSGTMYVAGPPSKAFRTAIRGIAGMDGILRLLEGQVRVATKASDIETAHATGRHCVIYNFQNSDPLEDDLTNLEVFYGLGVRVIQLTYQLRNLVGNGGYERHDDGLSLYGLEVVKAMNNLGIVIDISHCGVETRWEAIRHSKVPVALTHTSANALRTPHPRGTSDDQLRAVGESGGYVGLVALPHHLADGGKVAIDTLVHHVEHVAEVAGIDHVGIGSDINTGYLMARNDPLEARQGIFPRWVGPSWVGKLEGSENGSLSPRIEGLVSPGGLRHVGAALLRHGYTDEETGKIMGRNFLEYFRRVVGG